jgi:hypothetical protein
VDEAWVGIAGLAGTLVGTLGASWFGFRQLKVQLAEQRSEGERQRYFESVRDRREPREKAYVQLLARAQRLHQQLADGTIDTPGLSEQLRALSELDAAVAIQGPERVAEASRAILLALTHAFRRVHTREDPTSPAYLALTLTIGDAIRNFIRTAREALEDHGTNPGDRENQGQR